MKDSLCGWAQLNGVNDIYTGFHVGELTSVNTITFSPALFIDSFLSWEYSFNSPSTSRSNKRRGSAYANDVLRLGREARRGASFPDSIAVGRGVCRVECIRDRCRIVLSNKEKLSFENRTLDEGG